MFDNPKALATTAAFADISTEMASGVRRSLRARRPLRPADSSNSLYQKESLAKRNVTPVQAVALCGPSAGLIWSSFLLKSQYEPCRGCGTRGGGPFYYDALERGTQGTR